MRKVEVTAYNAIWPSLFEIESQQLQAIFKGEIVQIHHIGSTAVPGLSAKPIIDIMPVVKAIDRIDCFHSEMINIGYEPKGENGLPGRRYFQKGGDKRTHHIHVYEEGNPDIERHLAFRDYLRKHPEAADKYSSLKIELAKKNPFDIEAYIKGKSELVQEIEKKAINWYRFLK